MFDEIEVKFWPCQQFVMECYFQAELEFQKEELEKRELQGLVTDKNLKIQ